MKNIIIAMVLLLVCQTAVIAQKIAADKVPAPVKAEFKKKFPGATSSAWEIEKKDIYEVNFTFHKQKQSAQFDKNGKWQKTEIGLAIPQLPKAVAESFAKAFPGYKITEAERAETPEQLVIYELEIAKGTDRVEVQLLPNGDIIKREAISGKD